MRRKPRKIAMSSIVLRFRVIVGGYENYSDFVPRSFLKKSPEVEFDLRFFCDNVLTWRLPTTINASSLHLMISNQNFSPSFLLSVSVKQKFFEIGSSSLLLFCWQMNWVAWQLLFKLSRRISEFVVDSTTGIF